MINLLRYLKKKDWCFIIFSIGLIVCQVWLDLTMPDYTSTLTTAVASGKATMSDVWTNGSKMLLCAGGTLASAVLCGFLCAKIAADFAQTLRAELFCKIASFSNTEMARFSTPSLITRTSNDVVQLQMFIAMGLQILIKAPVLAIWAVCKISSASAEWTETTIIFVAVIVAVVGTIVALCYPKFKQIQKLTDRLNDVTRENISGVRVIRAFNAEEYQKAKFENVNDKITKNHLFTSKSTGLLMPVMTVCMNGLTLAIYWIGAYLIDSAALNEKANLFGNMTAFTSYALQVVMAFMMLIMIFVILPRTIVSANRIDEILKTTPSLKNGTNKSEGKTQGELEFKNVSFGYNGQANTIEDISFTAHRGETIAFIGATGSGKTTIANLISRFYDVSKGEILLNGINIKDYDESVLRSKISIASQKAVLFKGDIRHNVAYGCDEDKISNENVKKALQIAHADFVDELSTGINSDVAQGGTNFSGGQKQRISIARAIYKNAEIIIFDDTFSALDYKTDMLVRKSIKDNLKNATVLIIAQRIGTIKNADKIIVLDDGKIVGSGTHDELLKNCSVYKDIALSQLSKEEL